MINIASDKHSPETNKAANPAYALATETKQEEQARRKAICQSHEASLPRLAYTLKEACQILGISYITGFRLCQRGKLRSCGALRTKLIAKTELERFLRDTQEVGA